MSTPRLLPALHLALLGALAPPALRGSEPADFAARIDARIDACQPRPEEKRFDEIAWVDGILPARELARMHGRPVFLFTHDGRMGTGRC